MISKFSFEHVKKIVRELGIPFEDINSVDIEEIHEIFEQNAEMPESLENAEE